MRNPKYCVISDESSLLLAEVEPARRWQPVVDLIAANSRRLCFCHLLSPETSFWGTTSHHSQSSATTAEIILAVLRLFQAPWMWIEQLYGERDKLLEGMLAGILGGYPYLYAERT
ncbi:hypothetical protein GJ744_000737 [Endocarpon pusillum]|uniref:Uncharacterized protein n=1 Tax=Endocarpon pusillum TaxID=364733 RepID=A0A8H7AHY8_9EURO|nr:hypothetical protein GJ744_000737 [Endocarpon pusillum]